MDWGTFWTWVAQGLIAAVVGSIIVLIIFVVVKIIEGVNDSD